MHNRPIALGARLKSLHSIRTIGFKPNFSDYTDEEQSLLQEAPKIYYPTSFYADLFNAMGKETFPSFHTYKFAQDKIKQTAIFTMCGIPHPKTRVFYGPRQKQQILDYFSFPFVLKKARGSSKGRDVFLIRSMSDLNCFLDIKSPVYVQEYCPVDRDLRIIIIGKEIALSYWRLSRPGDFRTNVSQGGDIRFDPVPEDARNLALHAAAACGWDDVGIDIICKNGRFYVLEGNMKYGTRGFQKAGIDYRKMLESLILGGRI